MSESHRDDFKLYSFPPIQRGNWLIKVSVTNLRSIAALCANKQDPENTFVRFFDDRDGLNSFIDFLVLHNHHTLDQKF